MEVRRYSNGDFLVPRRAVSAGMVGDGMARVSQGEPEWEKWKKWLDQTGSVAPVIAEEPSRAKPSDPEGG